MRKYINILLVLLVLSTTVYGAELDFPQDRGILLYEDKTDTILFEENADDKFYPASTTKLMTALIALDELDLREEITVGDEISLITKDSSTAKLKYGEVLSVEELLYALLLPSGNDAACTLAVNVARKVGGTDSIGESMDYFVKMMNDKAKSLGAENTNFINPHGLHNEDHYTTPKDILIITEELLKNEEARKIVGTSEYEVVSNLSTHKWSNTNIFLHEFFDENTIFNQSGPNEYYDSSVTGVKTGFTDKAGRCLVFSATINDMELIGLIYHSSYPEIWEECEELMEYAENNFEYRVLVETGQEFTLSISRPFNDSESIQLSPSRDIAVVMGKGEGDKVSYEFDCDSSKLEKNDDGTYSQLEDISKGEVIGKLKLYDGNKLLGECNLTSLNQLKRKTVFSILPSWWKVILIGIAAFAVLNIKKRHNVVKHIK